MKITTEMSVEDICVKLWNEEFDREFFYKCREGSESLEIEITEFAHKKITELLHSHTTALKDKMVDALINETAFTNHQMYNDGLEQAIDIITNIT